jgi:hypothetical protein
MFAALITEKRNSLSLIVKFYRIARDPTHNALYVRYIYFPLYHLHNVKLLNYFFLVHFQTFTLMILMKAAFSSSYSLLISVPVTSAVVVLFPLDPRQWSYWINVA